VSPGMNGAKRGAARPGPIRDVHFPRINHSPTRVVCVFANVYAGARVSSLGERASRGSQQH